MKLVSVSIENEYDKEMLRSLTKEVENKTTRVGRIVKLRIKNDETK